jgi:hypothetical protein
MIRILVVFIGLMTSINASAFDVYGVSDTESKKIMKISGKDFGATNVSAWRSWVLSAK